MYRQTIKIQWPEFGDSVRAALLAYSDDVESVISKEAQKAAKLGVKVMPLKEWLASLPSQQQEESREDDLFGGSL